jgi:putative serine protease PepD
MGQPREEDSPGEGPEEYGSGAHYLPPEDRLWRHPSEVRGDPSLAAPPGRGRRAWAPRSLAWTWLVAVASGLLGAVATAAVLLATGLVGTTTHVVTEEVLPSTADPGILHKGVPNVTTVLETVEPSVVAVTVTGGQGVEAGSGVIVDTQGEYSFIVTDSALFAEAGSGAQVQVTSYWGDTESGLLVGQDPTSGIAVVKAVLLPLSAVSPANPGSVADIQTGEEVYAVGSSSAAVSANQSGFASGYINDTSSYFQPVNGASDAIFSMLAANMTVSPALYGGAVVDGNGNLLGITNQVAGAQPGLTYVTPIDTIMAEVPAIVKNGQAPPHAWLGVLQAADISGPGAQRLGFPDGAVQVDSVASGSPAAKAGIKDDDVITTLDGHSISSVGALIVWLDEAKPGQVMSVGWVHGGHRQKANITLGSQPSSASPI